MRLEAGRISKGGSTPSDHTKKRFFFRVPPQMPEKILFLVKSSLAKDTTKLWKTAVKFPVLSQVFTMSKTFSTLATLENSLTRMTCHVALIITLSLHSFLTNLTFPAPFWSPFLLQQFPRHLPDLFLAKALPPIRILAYAIWILALVTLE